MERYANLGGDSGITGYEIAADSITVQFKDGSVYLYSYASTGQRDVERMKQLAQQGQGLNSFISKHVKDRDARKLR